MLACSLALIGSLHTGISVYSSSKSLLHIREEISLNHSLHMPTISTTWLLFSLKCIVSIILKPYKHQEIQGLLLEGARSLHSWQVQ